MNHKKAYRKLNRKNYFGEIDMPLKKVIILAVGLAIVIGLLNSIPALDNTSFVQPAIGYEFWFVIALFIITNCKKPLEAVYKTFLFFLISQPLIYLVEVPFNSLGFGLFRYYKFWFILTLLTIPGSFIAFQVKRSNLISAIILSIATGFLFGTGIHFFRLLIDEFPRYIVSSIFSIFFSSYLIEKIIKVRNLRVVAYALSLIIGIIFGFFVNW